MKNFQVAVIVGSLRKESFNRAFAEAIIKLAPPEVAFRFVEIGGLPLYNQDDDANPPEAAKTFKQQIEGAQAVLFVTPEYNRSIPGVLKNALDHGSRPYGQSVWAGKPAGILGVSPGAIGTALAQQHLRTILAVLDMPTLGQPEGYIQMKDGLIDAAGNIGEESRGFLQGWMDRFVEWVKRNNA